MSFAEKKAITLEIIKNADEKLLGLIIALSNEYNQKEYIFSDDEIRKFEESKDEFYASGKKGFTVEEAHSMIRNQAKK